MYGNHSAHTTGYQNSEMTSSGYAYFPNHHHHHHLLNHHNHHESDTGYGSSNISTAVSPNGSNNCTTSNVSALNNHLYTHPHLYSPSAAEYGITTSAHMSSNNSPSEPYYDADNGHAYYNSASGPSPGSIQDPHIISTDNGLSYTNLDYMYNNQNLHSSSGYPIHPDEKVHHFNLSENILLGHSPTQSSQSSPSVAGPTWHHPSYIDSSLSHPIGLGNLGGGQSQHNNINNVSHNIDVTHTTASSPGLQNQSQQQQQNIQTYKWMQVKRNVPKPQGKLEICIVYEL